MTIEQLSTLPREVAVEAAYRLIRILTHRARDSDSMPLASETPVADEAQRITDHVISALEEKEKKKVAAFAPARVQDYIRQVSDITAEVIRRSAGFDIEKGKRELKGMHNLQLNPAERAESLQQVDEQFARLLAAQRALPPGAPDTDELRQLRESVALELRHSSMLPTVLEEDVRIEIDARGNTRVVKRLIVTGGTRPLTKVLHRMEGDEPLERFEDIALRVTSKDASRRVDYVVLRNLPTSKLIVTCIEPGVVGGDAYMFNIAWTWPNTWPKLLNREPDGWRQQFNSLETIRLVRIQFSLDKELPIIRLEGQGPGKPSPPRQDVDRRGWRRYIWVARDVPPAAILDLQLIPQ